MNNIASINIVTWADVRDKVVKANPKLASIIDEIKNPPPLLLAKYPFGTDMVYKGTFMVPTKTGQTSPISHNEVDPIVKQLLNYCSIPSCIYLNTTGETYIEINNSKISLNVFKAGSICGLWETLDEPNLQFNRRIWNVSIGTNLIFTLAKLGDIQGINRLEKKFHSHSIHMPKNVFGHFDLFKNIVNNPRTKSNWEGEILFFSANWFKKDRNNSSWLRLHYKLLRDEWKNSMCWRNKVTFDLLGQTFASVQSRTNLRPNAYLIDTIMYLLSIASGSSPAFTPVSDDDSYAPISLIQKELIECYELKHYIPTIMVTASLGDNDFDTPVYYSMRLPTMLGSSPNLRKPHSVLNDIRIVKKSIEALYEFLDKNNSPLFDLIKHVSFEFFHPSTDNTNNIKSTEELPIKDKRLIECHDKTTDRKFCASSSFLNGCVRITKKTLPKN